MPSEFNVVDLFCGAGGLSEGFRQSGFNILLGLDHNENAIDTHEANFPESTSICGDITEHSGEEIRDIIDDKRVDVVIGGPPCQGFSQARAGRRTSDDPRNSLFEHFLRIVEELNPKMVLMENVPGILSMDTDDGKAVTTAISERFGELGYSLKYRKINAADYGVPQKRKRVLFIASKLDKEPKFPKPTHAEKPQMRLDGKKIKKWVPVKDIVKDKESIDSVYFHSEEMIEGFRERKKEHEEKGYGFGWQFLNPEKPSYTISARYYKDGSGALIKYSEDEIRMLTEREAARVQSFPDDFEFKGGKIATYKQIGNAVPPKLAEKMAEKYKEMLKNH